MIMMVNVFFIIMLNQWIVVVDLKVGCKFDFKYGKIVKLCSMYNNYLMLLVIFFMLLNYYLLVFVIEYNWVIVVLVFLMGVMIWYFFNIMYVWGGMKWWMWCVIVILFILIMWLSMVGMLGCLLEEVEVIILLEGQCFVQVEGFEEVIDIVLGCCFMCYVCELFYDGIYCVFKGVILEISGDIVVYVQVIYVQLGVMYVMFFVNVSWMEEVECVKVVVWFKVGLQGGVLFY